MPRVEKGILLGLRLLLVGVVVPESESDDEEEEEEAEVEPGASGTFAARGG